MNQNCNFVDYTIDLEIYFFALYDCLKNMLKIMLIYDCLVEVLLVDKVKYKLDSEVYGAMFVIPTGIYMMLQWHVVNWDITEQWWLQLHLPSGVILHKESG